MNALVCSGGGAKGAFTAGIVEYILKKKIVSFDLAVGTSTGSLIGGPALLDDWTYLRDEYVGTENADVFNNSLLGKIVSLFVRGDIPINVDMSPLRDSLHDYYIQRGKLDEITARNKIIVVTTANMKTGETTYFSSEQVKNGNITKETFVDAIVASASIPILCKPSKIYKSVQNHQEKDVFFYDGGVKEFLPLEKAVELGADKIWAISTHPLKFNITDWGEDANSDSPGPFKAILWTLSSTLNEVERGDLFRALSYYRVGRARSTIEKIAQDDGLSDATREKLVTVIDDIYDRVPDLVNELYLFSPKQAMTASLEFDKSVMLSYNADGYNLAEDIYQNGGPNPFVDSGGYVIDLP